MNKNNQLEAKTLLETLKQNGHRTTKTRTLIVTHLSKVTSPVAASDLILMLKKHGRDVNKTTVYRELQFLKEQSVVNEIDLLEGQKRYELTDPNHHHHHLVCVKCQYIQCVEMPNDLDSLEKSIQKKHKFKITGHILEFFGICQKCS
jgi:Fur family ferric uptake transcriptional regulator